MPPRSPRTESAEPKLYVTNLSSLATLADVRQLFRAIGEVVAVEFAAERSQSTRATSAFVTMATLSGAEEAVRRLHGRLFHDRSMMVALAPENERTDTRSTEARSVGAKAPRAGASVQQQYRERNGMVYELDCEGLRLTLRFFFPSDGSSEQRVEARAVQGADFVAEATGATRQLALLAVAEAWRRPTDDAAIPGLDWAAITTALKTVRAI